MRFRRRVLFTAAVLTLMLVGCGDDGRSGLGDDGRVECDLSADGPAALVGIHPATGEQRWRFVADDQFSAAINRGVVGLRGSDGVAVAIDADTGERRWCRRLGGEHESAGSPWVQPDLVASGDLLVAVTADGAVVGIDPSTGDERWRTPVEPTEGLHLVGEPSAVVVDDAAASTGDPLAVLDADDGTSVGEVGHGTDTLSLETTSTYQEDRQEIGLAIEEGDGQPLWALMVPGFHAQLIGELVLVLDQTGGTGEIPRPGPAFVPADLMTFVSAHDARTGEERWRLAVPGTPQQVFDGGPVMLVASGPELVAFDAAGTKVWTVDHGSPGVGGVNSEPGTYLWMSFDPDSGTIVGLIRADQPYRD